MKIDCSMTLNYAKEVKRLCTTHREKHRTCSGCPLVALGCNIKYTTQEHIIALQKWSDEHLLETRAEHFFKMFPNAPKNYMSSIPMTCVKYLGWVKECEKGYSSKHCEECWNEPYVERGANNES